MLQSWCVPVIFALIVAAATPAKACRMERELPANYYEQFPTAVLVQVTGVALAPTGDAIYDRSRWNWDGEFEVQKVLRGKVGLRHLTRKERTGPSECDHLTAPTVGELKIFYFRLNSKTPEVLDLEEALQWDRKLRLSSRP